MRRLVLPLGASLLLHSGVVAVVWLLPRGVVTGGNHAGATAERPGLKLCLLGPQKRPAPPRPRFNKEEWATIDIGEPTVLAPSPIPGVLQVSAPVGTPGSPVPGSPAGGSPGGGVPSGPPPVLEVTKTVRRVVYLVDHSISMGPSGALERARQELRASLLSLPPDAWFQVLAYNSTVTPLVPATAGLAQLGTIDLPDLLARIDTLESSGRTNHLTALRRALVLQPEVIFLLTDAGDLRDDDIHTVTRLNEGRATIHIVELGCAGPSRADSPLRRLAAANAGWYRLVPVR